MFERSSGQMICRQAILHWNPKDRAGRRRVANRLVAGCGFSLLPATATGDAGPAFGRVVPVFAAGRDSRRGRLAVLK